MTHPDDADGPVTISAPLDFSRLSTGWPSPAAPFVESLNLHRILIPHPSATYLLRVGGDSMTPRIHPGDVVIVDRSLSARNQDVVVVIIGPDFLFRRYHRRGLSVLLVPDNPAYEPIELTQESEAVLWGVVAHVIAQPRVH